jgi:uncharacterized protein (TIGR00725 family)
LVYHINLQETILLPLTNDCLLHILALTNFAEFTLTKRKTIIGVMGGGSVDEQVYLKAQELGKLIAQEGWVLLCGGRPAGVMEAASQGAKDANGLVVGILPDSDANTASGYVDIAIATGIGDARNLINVLSSQVVIACRGGSGTISEIALAIKNKRPVVLLDFDPGQFSIPAENDGLLMRVKTPEQAIKTVKKYLHI